MSLTTSKTLYRAGYGPLMSGVTTVPYPYAVHGPIYDEGLVDCNNYVPFEPVSSGI